MMIEKMKVMRAEDIDGETPRMAERLVVPRLNEAHQHADEPARNEEEGDERAGLVDRTR